MVIEFRYLDPDWRSEHRDFYATTFRRYPSVAHRLHFFSDLTPRDFLSPDRPARLDEMHFLGYCVLRPVGGAPVGRTMLPPLVRDEVTCIARDEVNLFGTTMAVEGAPFIAQDAQLSRCAQTTTWATAYYHHLKFGGPRVLPGDIASAVADNLVHGRQVPSPGLSIGQMADAARSIGLPPLVYPLPDLASGEDVPRLVCRYLNSGIPVTITTRSHAFVLVGYARSRNDRGDDISHFVCHDDEVGPYRRIENWQLDESGPWEYAIVPLPRKVYLPGEDAEEIGKTRIFEQLDRTRSEAAELLVAKLQGPARPLSFRSTVVLSNEFKKTLPRTAIPRGRGSGLRENAALALRVGSRADRPGTAGRWRTLRRR